MPRHKEGRANTFPAMNTNTDAMNGNPASGTRPDFYDSIFGPEGLRVLAVFKNGLKSPPAHYYFKTNEELAQAADAHNASGKNVYHACATFKEPINRKGENVQALKCLFLDLDVGKGKSYASKTEAYEHNEKFRVALKLPLSHVVDSGNGVHAYQPFTKAITPEQWDKLADLFRACLDHYGVKHDPSRTTDKASILRIPGTHNHKDTTPKEVKLKRLGEEVPAADLWAKLKTYADANGLIVWSKPVKGKTTAKNKLTTGQTYPPSYAENIITRCAVLREVDESGGDVAYGVWWRALGVAKFTTAPEFVAAHWTRNRSATGHAQNDWKGFMDAWSAGPTTCAEFAKHSAHCATCPEAKGAV
jgi:hypothetical protein